MRRERRNKSIADKQKKYKKSAFAVAAALEVQKRKNNLQKMFLRIFRYPANTTGLSPAGVCH